MPPTRFTGLITLFALTGSSLLASADVDPRIAKSFEHFYNLEYDQALSELYKAEQAHPDDPAIHNYIAQNLLYREMFRNGALESELVSGNNAFLRREKLNPTAEVQKEFDDELNRSMALSKAQIAADPKDTKAIYKLGVSYALRSNYNFLVRKSWREALGDATQARKLHDKVIQLDPGNYDARLLPGLHEYIVGSLSWTWRALGFLAGFHGDKEGGIRKLEEVSRLGKFDNRDAEVLLCAIYRREGKTKAAIPLLNSLIRDFPRNYLFLFEKAQMYAALGDKKEALGAIDQVRRLKTASQTGFREISWEKIYYEEGNIEFWYNDLDQALTHLKKATAPGKELDLNTGVLAYMRQGQIYDLKSQHNLAKEAYQQAMNFAPQSEAAKESRGYINSPYKRKKAPPVTEPVSEPRPSGSGLPRA